MKLNQHTKRKNKGMTLLELTVVILVLLSLISILFIGARAWKKGSDRSANILNVRNVQQAVRGHANMNGIAELGEVLNADILGTDPGDYMAVPTPPIGAAYGYADVNPAVGALYITNATDGADRDASYFYATAADYSTW